MSRLIDLRGKQAKLIADARAKNDEITVETTESRAAEILNEYNAIMAEHDRLEGIAKREEQLAALEARANEAADASQHEFRVVGPFGQ